jgi:hypothetical protein
VCAQIIVSGHRAAESQDIGIIARNIKGMIFLGTPFGGSSAAKWGNLVRRVFNVLKRTDGNTLQTLIPDSHDLKTLRNAFPDVVKKRNESTDPSEKIGIVFFFERHTTYGNMVCCSLPNTIFQQTNHYHRLWLRMMPFIVAWVRQYQCSPTTLTSASSHLRKTPIIKLYKAKFLSSCRARQRSKGIL